jgi:hypothetical protein
MTSTIRKGLLALMLVGLGAAASVGYAQVTQGQISPPEFSSRPQTPPSPKAADGLILSGADIGFRVERSVGHKVVGRWVVRVNGEWREVAASYEAKPLTVR